MVIRKGKTETEKTIEEIKFPKWLDNLITKKWFLYVATAVVLVLFVGFSLPASTRDNLANAIFAETATDVSAKGPIGDINPPIIGAATPTPTEGKEKTTAKEVQSSGSEIYNIESIPNLLVKNRILLYNMKIDSEKKYLTGFIKVTDLQPYNFNVRGTFYNSENYPVLGQTGEVLASLKYSKIVYSSTAILDPGKEYAFRILFTQTNGIPVKNIKGVQLLVGG